MAGVTSLDVHPEMQILIEAKAGISPGSSIEEMRSVWHEYAARTHRPYPAGMQVEDRFMSAAPDADCDIPVRVYRSADAPPRPACVAYFHGGGFMKGDLETSDAVAWGIAQSTGAVVVSVDYRLAPEHPYPAAFDDCYAVLEHLASGESGIAIDGARLGVWGDSAGGCLATAVCLAARDRNGPKIAVQALNYPCLDDDVTSDSYVRYADAPGLTKSAMDKYWSWYLGDRRPSADPYAVPARATDLANLPPAHIHIAQFDPLADDGRRYAEALERAGVEVRLRCAQRMIHGALRARFTGADAAAEYEAICAFVREHLA